MSMLVGLCSMGVSAHSVTSKPSGTLNSSSGTCVTVTVCTGCGCGGGAPGGAPAGGGGGGAPGGAPAGGGGVCCGADACCGTTAASIRTIVRITGDELRWGMGGTLHERPFGRPRNELPQPRQD